MSDAAPTPATEFTFDRPRIWSRLRHTPWHDLIDGRISGALHHRLIILVAELPDNLKTTIEDVVTRTRLWPRERQDVASELCDHFVDGLGAGRSPEQLVADFGDPSTAAELIRRAKIRCRPWWWQIWHFGWLTLLSLCVVVAVFWSGLVVRYLSATPTVKFDLIAQYDDRSREVPEDERAWPIYRRGLVTIDRQELYELPVNGRKILTREALIEGPTHPHWPEARAYLSQHEDAVRLFEEGAEKSELGFINRDPGNEAWRQWEAGVGWETYNPPGTGGPMVLLAQTQDLRIVFSFLRGAMHAAIEDRDGSRAVELAVSLLQFADHVRQTHDGRIADLSAFSYFTKTLRQIRRLVFDNSDLVTPTDLQKLDECVSTALGGGVVSYRMEGELRMWQDYLQRIYTDDGQGDGRLTPEGLDRIVRYGIANQNDLVLRDLLSYVQRKDDDGMVDSLSTRFVGSAVAEMIADRRTMEQQLIELNALHREMLADVDTLPSDSRYYQEIKRMVRDEPLRFLPYTVFVDESWGEWESRGGPARRLVAVNLERDATLLAIALERYRRQSGDWPETLSELVPNLLPEVPVDRFAGGDERSLSYRLLDGAPLVYSVGRDHTDNGGDLPSDGLPGWKADTCDWRLIPAEDEWDR